MRGTVQRVGFSITESRGLLQEGEEAPAEAGDS